jgi:hypothetical protein
MRSEGWVIAVDGLLQAMMVQCMPNLRATVAAMAD